MLINRGMDREDVVHIYNELYYSAIKRNEVWSFAEMRMDLEIITQSEIS